MRVPPTPAPTPALGVYKRTEGQGRGARGGGLGFLPPQALRGAQKTLFPEMWKDLRVVVRLCPRNWKWKGDTLGSSCHAGDRAAQGGAACDPRVKQASNLKGQMTWGVGSQARVSVTGGSAQW